MDYDPKRRWFVELTEEQLVSVIHACEDVHRFLAGQTELAHTTHLLPFNDREHVQEALKQTKPYVTPDLSSNASYDWAMNHCPNEEQRKEGARLYGIYRELLHILSLYHHEAEDGFNVYTSPTLVCNDSRPLPKATTNGNDQPGLMSQWRDVAEGRVPADAPILIGLRNGGMAVAAFYPELAKFVSEDVDQEYWWDMDEVKCWMPAPYYPMKENN